MTPAEHARDAAISMEVKKDGLQQRQGGDWAIKFTVQAIDMHERLTRAPMGTRFMAVLVEIGDDELPISQPAKEEPAKPRPSTPVHKVQAGAQRERKPWRDLGPATQSGIRCEEATFAAFLREHYPDDWHESQDAAACVRLICGVGSRADLSLPANHRQRVIWHSLNDKYEAWKALEHA
jgi:hypothetical protein